MRAAESRAQGLSLMLVAAACLIAAAGGAAMSWDGAALFLAALDTQDVSLPHGRLGVAIFQYPALWVSRYTGSVKLSIVVYGLLYASVPFVGLGSARRVLPIGQERLFVWPCFGVCLATLPGQFFFVSDAIIALHLSWAPLLAIATLTVARHWLLVLSQATFVFFLHPVAAVTFATGAIIALVTLQQRRVTVASLVVIACTALAVARMRWLPLSTHELGLLQTDLKAIWFSMRVPVVGGGLTLAVAFALLIVRPVLWVRERWLKAASVAALAVAGLDFVAWASRVADWQNALNYRFIAPLLVTPLFLAAAIDARRSSVDDERSAREAVQPLRLGAIAALIFCVTIAVQTARWQRLRLELLSALADHEGGCVPMSSLAVTRRTPLSWWPTPSYAIVIQGRTPTKLVLDGKDCSRADFATRIRINPWWTRERQGGWFDLRQAGYSRQP